MAVGQFLFTCGPFEDEDEDVRRLLVGKRIGELTGDKSTGIRTGDDRGSMGDDGSDTVSEEKSSPGFIIGERGRFDEYSAVTDDDDSSDEDEEDEAMTDLR